MSAFRVLRQISTLNTRTISGLVTGMRPSTTPIGVAISITWLCSSLCTTPTPGCPASVRIVDKMPKNPARYCLDAVMAA
jgi:hypothetical protein